MDDDAEIIAESLVEPNENLEQLGRDLVELEQPGSRELLSSIFRTIHTIRGTSGSLAFGRLEEPTHVGETLLSRLRDGEQEMKPPAPTRRSTSRPSSRSSSGCWRWHPAAPPATTDVETAAPLRRDRRGWRRPDVVPGRAERASVGTPGHRRRRLEARRTTYVRRLPGPGSGPGSQPAVRRSGMTMSTEAGRSSSRRGSGAGW
jgi:hypothetical protein